MTVWVVLTYSPIGMLVDLEVMDEEPNLDGNHLRDGWRIEIRAASVNGGDSVIVETLTNAGRVLVR